MSELEKEHAEQLKVAQLDATIVENEAKQPSYGFRSHGLVIHDNKGEVVFKQADHNVVAAEVKAFVVEYLKDP